MENAAKEEKAAESNGDEESFKDEIFLQGKELENANSKMIEAIEENQKLRRSLNQIMKDYQTLQTKYNNIIALEASNGSMTNKLHTQDYQETDESDHFISLSLGRTSSSSEQLLKNEVVVNENKEGEKEKEGFSLGLDCKYEISSKIPVKPNPENSMELGKEENGQRELAIKGSSSLRCEDEEVTEKNPNKKTRVSVRVRCNTPTLNDGCQWRKYGQKIAKGNPCPRAYYRCTIAPSCPVRKQVQRCAQDMSILIITYEGAHNHPLPMSATAMASATSAAASGLLSGSSTSSSIDATSSSNIDGLNFNPSDFSKYKQFYIPYNSTASTNATITLDLTSSSSSSIFNKYSSNYLSTPKYSTTNLSFNPLESNPLPLSWSGAQVGNSLNFGGQYGTYEQNMHKPPMQNPNSNSHQQTLASDTIAAAAKAITSDPNFQSALITALSSFIGNRGNGGETSRNQSGDSKNILEAYPGVSNLPPTSSQNEYNFFSSNLGRDPKVTSDQQGNMALFQPQLPFDTTPKSKSSSPSDEDPIL